MKAVRVDVAEALGIGVISEPSASFCAQKELALKILLMSALALSVLAGGAASAQTYDHRADQQGAYQQGGDRHDGGDRRDYGHRGHRSCFWRHHQRVCRWVH
jgi:hypothetical protein